MCFKGLKLTRPSRHAVSSPKRWATKPCASDGDNYWDHPNGRQVEHIRQAAVLRARLPHLLDLRSEATRACSAPIESGGFSWGQRWESLSALIRFWEAGRCRRPILGRCGNE